MTWKMGSFIFVLLGMISNEYIMDVGSCREYRDLGFPKIRVKALNPKLLKPSFLGAPGIRMIAHWEERAEPFLWNHPELA